ncbi:hypothetical protein [Paracoccus pacificus]|uniref:Uncharacterized protein n=1 Tax=Paracoccus pacificus TaxID=1463598 RepID=A0ABW4R4F5_9RHOB
MDYLPAVGLLLAALMALIVFNLLSTAVPGQYLIIARPGIGRVEMLDIVFRANGGVVGFGGLSNVAIAASADPGFSKAVRVPGVWLVMPSPRLLGCFTPLGGAV